MRIITPRQDGSIGGITPLLDKDGKPVISEEVPE